MSVKAMTDPTSPFTVILRRRIKDAAVPLFETMTQEFIAFDLRQPGHLVINVVRSAQGSRDYTVLDCFASEEVRRGFTSSTEYLNWMQSLGEVSEAILKFRRWVGNFYFTASALAPR